MKQNTPQGQDIKSLHQNHKKLVELAKDAFSFLLITAIFLFLAVYFLKKATDEHHYPASQAVAIERGVE